MLTTVNNTIRIYRRKRVQEQARADLLRRDNRRVIEEKENKT